MLRDAGLAGGSDRADPVFVGSTSDGEDAASFPEIRSTLEDPAPATAAALALAGGLDCWPATYAPPSAHGRVAPPAEIPGGTDLPTEGSEEVALALWKEGRTAEAIEILELQIAAEKRGLPALVASSGPPASHSKATAPDASAAPPVHGRALRPRALIAVCAAAALLTAGASLWARTEAPRLEIARPVSESIPAAGATAPELPPPPSTAEAEEAAPAADGLQAAPSPKGPSVADADAAAAEAPVAASALPAAVARSAPQPASTAAAPPPAVEAAPTQEVRLPKRRPEEPSAQATLAREPPAPKQVLGEERTTRRIAPPPRAPRKTETAPPATAREALRTRLAERRAAARSYAAKRRAAAERRNARPEQPSLLLGGRGLP